MKMTKTSLSGTLLLSLLAIGVANAATEKEDIKEKEDNKPPIGCHNTGYQFELKTLHLSPGSNGDNQSMYVLFNELNQPISLFQMRNEESSRSIYLNHVIGAHEWAVLSTSEKQVKFICTVPQAKSKSQSQSQYGQVVDCAQSIRICEYINVRYGLNNRGNYWLTNSGTKGGATSAVVHYGIIPGL